MPSLPDRSLDTEILALGAIKQLRADLFQRLDIAGSEGDSDLVDFLMTIVRLCSLCNPSKRTTS
jgi:hypothetical protein